ncbi:hypothetical protein jhhlp_008618 [Lomentospora prolificans]|uniref:FAD-binding domain-containing protein n=1 Tax=Lomentospora prolificans TaxID=41688 RepID=A0A2N3MYI9_9PEZI|nr:hypothetical protein jhhlp_008618 [Lomentospora prolificans]
MPGDRTTEDGIHVIVIGAGLAGLAVSISTKLANPRHQVTIFETAKVLQEIGLKPEREPSLRLHKKAGLQITPNATKLLQRWSVADALAPVAIAPRTLTVRRYDGTSILAHEGSMRSVMEDRYGAPFWDVHRVDLQRELVRRCGELGVRIELGRRVVDVNFAAASVALEGGREEKGDAVVCAEGLWSSTRAKFLGRESEPAPTGDLAFRISFETKDLKGPHREEIRALARSEAVNFWIGPGCHAVSYAVRGGDVLNVGLLKPDDLPEGVARVDADPEEMRAMFRGWDPLLMKMLEEVDHVQRWRLLWVDALEEWTTRDGRFFMIGDSCHPMLPYLAQGANSALEDGAVLGYLLGKVGRGVAAVQLPAVAEMYQALRRERGKEIQRESFRQRKDFHLPDGEQQVARDAVFREAFEKGEPGEGFPSRWTCPRVQRFLYGYDAYAEAEALYQKSSSEGERMLFTRGD